MTVERKNVKTPPAQLQAAKEEDDEVINDSHNWRGIGISLLVILGICSIIALAILLLTPKNSGDDLDGDRIQLSELVDGAFEPRRFNGSWIADDKLEYRDADGHLVIFYVRTKVYKRILENTTFADYNVQKYSVSADHNYVLLQHDVEKLYRYSFKAKYKIYDLQSRKIYPLYPSHDPEGSLQYAAWGPKRNQLVYVYENNIFYVPNVNDTQYQLTATGIPGVIFNGVTDWLYGEEILKSAGAIWFSPDGNLICYSCFNDTKVGTFYYEIYMNQSGSNSTNLYPELFSIRYPKPGGENPAAFLWVVDVRSPGKFLLRDVKPPREVQDQLVHVWDHYFTSVQWMDNENLAVIWMARSQNFSVITRCTSTLWFCHVIYEQRPPSRRGWLDLYDPIYFGHGGRSWFLRLPLPEGYHGHFKHVAVVYNDDNKHVDYLTQGLYDIHKIVGYNNVSNTVFYLSTIEGRPGERHLYSVSGKKVRFSSLTKCLTCHEGNSSCLYNNAIFSPNGEYYILECLGPNVPKVEIRSIYNQTIDVLDSNSEVNETVHKKLFPRIRTFQVPLKGDYKAQVRLFLPPGLIEDEVLLYPLIVFADSSPGSQLVSQAFNYHWGQYMSGRRNCIYALIDGRGTAYQGDKMMHEVYYQLGTPEVEDQIEVTRYLRDNLPFIHPKHIAIWGWFYGGYVAASALAHEDTVFKCAVSVAPVTSWRYYDSTYSERYMGTPEQPDNYVGYERSSLIKKARQFKKKKLLIVHGTADDKVHLQHSLLFMKALIDEGVIFQSQIYPDEDHDLKNVKRHLYRTMEEYFNECFYIQRKDDYENTIVKKDIKTR